MEHYYSSNPTSKSEERVLEYYIQDKVLKFISDNGVFSKNSVDFATNLLIKTVVAEKIEGSVLDVGCGYGVIGITLAKLLSVDVTMLDVNERALDLARRNASKNGIEAKVIESDGFANISENYDIIITNPPIRAGKEVVYGIYRGAKEHLNPGGKFYLVINKKHGAPSTITYLKELFENVEVLDKKAGFHVIRCM
ncbi:MAG: class I SAM-dependent methyltransferase [Clostridia bacterium]|nr:class I SAM-dependent methyltransferase [Clostridia bacterium]